jgi:hypothetical protein
MRAWLRGCAGQDPHPQVHPLGLSYFKSAANSASPEILNASTTFIDQN